MGERSSQSRVREVLDQWTKASEDFLWTAEILANMGRYPQALMLLCHALHLCKCKGNYRPLGCCPTEYLELLFPKDGKTPEDLVTDAHVHELMKKVKECLGL